MGIGRDNHILMLVVHLPERIQKHDGTKSLWMT